MKQWFCFLRVSFADLDIAVQESVYHSFYQFVYRDIHSMVHDHSLTEDIIQDAFLKAIIKSPRLRSHNNMPAWIKQLAHNIALDYLRKRKQDYRILEKSYVHINNAALSEISVANEVEARERYELLYQAINEVKSEYRNILISFYIEGKSYREICQEMRLTQSVLTQRLARARKKLHQLYSEKWTDNE
ncbi:RNA polymerase sigma factor SigM [compost metagenome]